MTSDKSTLLALGIIAAVLLLALSAWSVSLFAHTHVSARGLMPTPTKTPGASLIARAKGLGFSLVHAPLPTFTPTPGPSPTPTPTAAAQTDVSADASESETIDRLRELAQSYGLNPLGDYIIVDQDAQEMFVVSQGESLRTLSVTTGDPNQGWDTPAWFGLVGEYWGTFQGAGGVRADDGWWLFQHGGNFLIHSLPYTLDASGRKHYAGRNDLGAAPASHGCIRLDPADARWLTRWNPQGKPIIILPLSDKN